VIEQIDERLVFAAVSESPEQFQGDPQLRQTKTGRMERPVSKH